MTAYDPKRHHRRSIRLCGYDYSQAGLYFITLCCQDRSHFFGVVKDGNMILNSFGKIIGEEWLNTPNIRDNVKLHEFVVLPNHFHGIVEILFKKGENKDLGKFKSPSHTIGTIIRGFKIATIKKIKDSISASESAQSQKIIKLNFRIWQRNYYENIIRSEKDYQRITNYIINNPAKWDEDKLHKR